MCSEEPQIRIMKDAEVEEITSLSRTTRQSLTRRGEFPSPVWITGRTRGYLSDEIDAWMNERRDMRSIRQDKPWKPLGDRASLHEG